jgi:hypothetical protein
MATREEEDLSLVVPERVEVFHEEHSPTVFAAVEEILLESQLQMMREEIHLLIDDPQLEEVLIGLQSRQHSKRKKQSEKNYVWNLLCIAPCFVKMTCFKVQRLEVIEQPSCLTSLTRSIEQEP